MKKCEYCAKELESYHLQYCKDTDCENLALKFYDTRNKCEKTFGVINIICIIAIMAGLIAAMFAPVLGNFIVAGSLVLLGITVLIWPFAPESFYKKYRIKKTTFLVRIFGVILLVAAIMFGVVALHFNGSF